MRWYRGPYVRQEGTIRRSTQPREGSMGKRGRSERQGVESLNHQAFGPFGVRAGLLTHDSPMVVRQLRPASCWEYVQLT